MTRTDTLESKMGQVTRDQLVELCREHAIRTDIVHEAHDVESLLRRLVDETARESGGDHERLHSLVLFAGRAAAIEEKAGADSPQCEWPAAGSSGPDVDELLKKLSFLVHKINNPLTSLTGRAQILEMNPGLDERTRHGIEVVSESGRRIVEYVREFAAVLKEAREELEGNPVAGRSRTEETPVG